MLVRQSYVACWICAVTAMACCLAVMSGCGPKGESNAETKGAASKTDAAGAKGPNGSTANTPPKPGAEPIQFDQDAFVKDPYVVPNGNNATLLYYIKQFSEHLVPANSEEEGAAILCKRAIAIRKAAEKVLDSNPTPEQRQEAMVRKLESLYITAKKTPTPLEQQTGKAALRKFALELLQDNDPTLVRMGRGNLLKIDLEEVVASDGEKSNDLVNALETLLAAEQAGGDEYNLAMRVAGNLENIGQFDAALRAFAAIGKTFGAEHIPPPLAKLANSAADDAKTRIGLIGKPLELTGTFVDGSPLNWAEYRGKVVLVDFWATWCGPCIGEIPNVKKNYDRFHDKGFDVLGVSLDDDKKNVIAFAKENQIPWKSLIGEGQENVGWNHPLVKKFGIREIPTTILVDREGKVLTLAARGERLTKALEKLLGNDAPPAPKLPVDALPPAAEPPAKPAEKKPDPPTAQPTAEPAADKAEKKASPESSSKNEPPNEKSDIQLVNNAVDASGAEKDESLSPAVSAENAPENASKLSGNPYLPGKKASLADLIELLGQMRDTAESIKKRAGFHDAIVEIADRVLASDANEKSKTLATLAKLESLHALSLASVQSADDAIRPMLENAKKSSDAALAREALFQSLEQRTMASDELKTDAMVSLLDEIEKYFGKEPPITRQSRLASGVVHVINRIDDNKIAKKQMVRFAAIFRKSKDQDLVRYGRKLAEAAGVAEEEKE